MGKIVLEVTKDGGEWKVVCNGDGQEIVHALGTAASAVIQAAAASSKTPRRALRRQFESYLSKSLKLGLSGEGGGTIVRYPEFFIEEGEESENDP